MTYLSHADLGGEDGYGAVVPEPEGELFHAPWEPRALAITLAMGATGAWNIDMSRSARETLPGYRGLSYYEIWIAGLERLMAERGLVTADEIAAGQALSRACPVGRVLRAEDVAGVLAKGSATERPATCAARFRVGQPVRTRSAAVGHHTRLPGYARGRRGVIDRVHGAHVFADTNAQGLGEQPQWLYTVAFDASELWGADAAARFAGVDRRLGAVPGGPVTDEPVFAAPWQAQTFALVESLRERGLFTSTEWAAALSDEIARAQAAGDEDLGDTYYAHYLAALEEIVATKGASSADELDRYRDAWDRAAHRTSHGHPIELQPGDFAGTA